MIGTVIFVLIKRLFGFKKLPGWNLSTEIIWATTRLTLLSSNEFGLSWLKTLSTKFSPKPKLAKSVIIEKLNSDNSYYLKICPKYSKAINNKLIIYFHGGGYVIGSPETSLEFTTRLSLESNAVIIAPSYPLAPESTYPMAHNSAYNFVQIMVETYPNYEIFLAGDSAGGALALSSFQNLSKEQKEKISGCILISPWIDPLDIGGSIESNSLNDVGDRNFTFSCYELYVKDKNILDRFPLNFVDRNLSDMPSTFVSIGDAEILLDQVLKLSENMKNQDIEITLKVYKGMFHTFWNEAPTIKEAEVLISDIGKWIEQK